ncbi:MAG: hypothetical protein P1U36_06390 [Legionellaceae bacterium]|nr:hypothetical protein [Legionellaceae bacterium]
MPDDDNKENGAPKVSDIAASFNRRNAELADEQEKARRQQQPRGTKYSPPPPPPPKKTGTPSELDGDTPKPKVTPQPPAGSPLKRTVPPPPPKVTPTPGVDSSIITAFDKDPVLGILIASYTALKGHNSAGNGVCEELLEVIKKIEPDFEPPEPVVSSQGVTKASTASGTSGLSGAPGGQEFKTAPMASKTHLQLLKELDGKLEDLLKPENQMSDGVRAGLSKLQVTVKQSIAYVDAQEKAKGVTQNLREGASENSKDDKIPEDPSEKFGL